MRDQTIFVRVLRVAACDAGVSLLMVVPAWSALQAAGVRPDVIIVSSAIGLIWAILLEAFWSSRSMSNPTLRTVGRGVFLVGCTLMFVGQVALSIGDIKNLQSLLVAKGPMVVFLMEFVWWVRRGRGSKK